MKKLGWYLGSISIIVFITFLVSVYLRVDFFAQFQWLLSLFH